MENESTLGHPIPTAVLTPTEIITPTNLAADLERIEAPIEASATAEQSIQLPMNMLAEMMLAPITFWASVSASYLKLFDLAAKPSARPRMN